MRNQELPEVSRVLTTDNSCQEVNSMMNPDGEDKQLREQFDRYATYTYLI